MPLSNENTYIIQERIIICHKNIIAKWNKTDLLTGISHQRFNIIKFDLVASKCIILQL